MSSLATLILKNVLFLEKMIKIQIIQNPLKLIGKMVKILLSKKFRKNKKIRKLVKLELLKKRKKFLVSSIYSIHGQCENAIYGDLL